MNKIFAVGFLGLLLAGCTSDRYDVTCIVPPGIPIGLQDVRVVVIRDSGMLRITDADGNELIVHGIACAGMKRTGGAE